MPSLLERAAADLTRILSDAAGGFAVPIRVVDPSSNAATINGLATDIGIKIDPETGVAVSGRKASVAFPLAKLLEAGLDDPRGITDNMKRPWTVTLELPTGGEGTFKISGTVPDRLGCIVCFLEEYET